jgi:hypothetical protein
VEYDNSTEIDKSKLSRLKTKITHLEQRNCMTDAKLNHNDMVNTIIKYIKQEVDNDNQ